MTRHPLKSHNPLNPLTVLISAELALAFAALFALMMAIVLLS